MKPLLIHIGFPKAMSSWLQKRFFTPEQGFQMIMDPMACQLEIIDPAPFSPPSKEIAEKIQLFEAGNTDRKLTGVISSEALAGNMYAGAYNAKQNADRLHQIAPNAKILIVTREQKTMIRSLYKSWVLWGMPYTIEEIMNPVMESIYPQFRAEYLAYDTYARYYSKLFGGDNVLVIPYEVFDKKPFLFLKTICDFSETATTHETLASLPLKRKINQGMPLETLYWQLLLNRYIYKTPFNPRGFFPLNNEKILKRIALSKKKQRPPSSETHLEKKFCERVSRSTRNVYTKSNQALQEFTAFDLNELGYELG